MMAALHNPVEQLFLLDFGSALGGPLLVAGLAVFGLVVGVVTGLFGVGGAFMITPLLYVLFGIPTQFAVASSVPFTIGSGVSGLARHMRLRNYEPRSMLILGLSAAGVTVLGAKLNALLHATWPQQYDIIMGALFVGILLLTAWIVARDAGRGVQSPRRSLCQRLPLGPYIDLPAAELTRVSLPALVLVGGVFGLSKGLLGIGGGVLLMPLLILVVGLRIHQAIGTSLGVVLVTSLIGSVTYTLMDNGGQGHYVRLWIVLALLAGSVVGVQVGSYIAQRLPGDRLKRRFAQLVLVVALATAAKLATDLFH